MLATLFMTPFALLACGVKAGNPNSTSPTAGKGGQSGVTLLLSQEPVAGIEALVVRVQAIAFLPSSGDERRIDFDTPVAFDLMKYRAVSRFALVAGAALPPGRYRGVRLIFSPDAPATAKASGTEVPVWVGPGGARSSGTSSAKSLEIALPFDTRAGFTRKVRLRLRLADLLSPFTSSATRTAAMTPSERKTRYAYELKSSYAAQADRSGSGNVTGRLDDERDPASVVCLVSRKTGSIALQPSTLSCSGPGQRKSVSQNREYNFYGIAGGAVVDVWALDSGERDDETPLDDDLMPVAPTGPVWVLAHGGTRIVAGQTVRADTEELLSDADAKDEVEGAPEKDDDDPPADVEGNQKREERSDPAEQLLSGPERH